MTDLRTRRPVRQGKHAERARCHAQRACGTMPQRPGAYSVHDTPTGPPTRGDGGSDGSRGTPVLRTADPGRWRRSPRTDQVMPDRGGRCRGRMRARRPNVLRAAGLGTRVANPLAGFGDDRLPGPHVDGPRLVLDPQQAAQHHRELPELGPLPRFDPSLGRDHPGDAEFLVPRVHPPGVLLDPLRQVSGRLHDRGAFDQSGHRVDRHWFRAVALGSRPSNRPVASPNAPGGGLASPGPARKLSPTALLKDRDRYQSCQLLPRCSPLSAGRRAWHTAR